MSCCVCVINVCILVPACSVSCRLVYSLLPGVPVCQPCPALMSLKTVILSLRPRLRVPVSSSCVHRDSKAVYILFMYCCLQIYLRKDMDLWSKQIIKHIYLFEWTLVWFQGNVSGYVCNPSSSRERDAASGDAEWDTPRWIEVEENRTGFCSLSLQYAGPTETHLAVVSTLPKSLLREPVSRDWPLV